MSQKICRYYLKGNCKYGSRCHYLHEDVDPSFKENYSGYPYVSFHDKYYSDTSSHYYKNANNYNRYHVDNRRYNQAATKSTSDEELLYDIIKQELKEFEERHNWFFTVVAPIKDFGNIPGLKDLSPEELRFQYYKSCSNNSLQEFVQNLNSAKNDVAQICQLFKTKSQEALELAKNMIKKKSNDEMTTDYQSGAASTFKFDLNALSKPSVFPTQHIQPFEYQISNIPAETVPVAGSAFSSGDFLTPHVDNSFVNQSPVSAFAADSTSQQASAISSFSFDLNKLQPGQKTQPSGFHSFAPSSTSTIVNNSTSRTNSSVFGNANFNSDTSFFGSPKVSEKSTLIANNSTSGSNVFGNSTSGSTIENSVYSKPDEIPADAYVAFQAKFFQIGLIPLVAPSKELCLNGIR